MNKPTIAALIACVGLVVSLSTLYERGWWPVAEISYRAHVDSYQSDRLDRLCAECRSRCFRICAGRQECQEACLEECDRAECA